MALRALRLRANQIRLVDEGAIDVLGLLLSSEECALQSLDLSANNLRDEGALVLAEEYAIRADLLLRPCRAENSLLQTFSDPPTIR